MSIRLLDLLFRPSVKASMMSMGESIAVGDGESISPISDTIGSQAAETSAHEATLAVLLLMMAAVVVMAHLLSKAIGTVGSWWRKDGHADCSSMLATGSRTQSRRWCQHACHAGGRRGIAVGKSQAAETILGKGGLQVRSVERGLLSREDLMLLLLQSRNRVRIMH